MTVAPFPTHGWRPDDTATGDPRVPARKSTPSLPTHNGVWRPCPMCWGQRKILLLGVNGEIVAQGQCYRCMGHGEVFA